MQPRIAPRAALSRSMQGWRRDGARGAALAQAKSKTLGGCPPRVRTDGTKDIPTVRQKGGAAELHARPEPGPGQACGAPARPFGAAHNQGAVGYGGLERSLQGLGGL